VKRGVADNTVHYTAAYYETQLKQKEDTHTASVCQFSIYVKPNQTKFDILDSAFHFLAKCYYLWHDPSVVCQSSVTLLRHTQRFELFGDVSAPPGT